MFHEGSAIGMLLSSFALLAAACEAGYRFGDRKRRTTTEKSRAHFGTLEAGVLGMLALLIGFTFSMALSRFENRQQLVTEEANAIGTSILRARLYTSPASERLVQELTRYVDMRIDIFSHGADAEVLAKGGAPVQAAHERMWTALTDLVAAEPSTAVLQGLVNSMNETIDLHAKRLAAARNHVPALVIPLLLFMSALSGLLIGLGNGLAGQRNQIVTLLFCLTVAMVITLIVDLDRPRSGIIRPSQASMIDLRESLKTK